MKYKAPPGVSEEEWRRLWEVPLLDGLEWELSRLMDEELRKESVARILGNVPLQDNSHEGGRS